MKPSNCAICLDCTTFLWSRHRHDYVSCSCANRTFVDGGDEYQRSGGMNLAKIAYLREGLTFQTGVGLMERVTVLSHKETCALLVSKFTWGSHGKDGKSPLVVKPLDQLDTDHIRAILRTQHISPEYTTLFNYILSKRA